MENKLPELAKEAMKSGAGWIKFYAITMITFSAIAILFLLTLFSQGNQMMSVASIVLFLICLFIWIHIVLLQYAINLTKSIIGANRLLEIAFAKQKSYFIFTGVISILTLLSNLFNIFTAL